MECAVVALGDAVTENESEIAGPIAERAGRYAIRQAMETGQPDYE
ncbi:MAG TPA: hypothetical protein VLF59_01500 [Candidatus Saccharimonadales bacterium]|nr:hypothetical protein [Candidatus Saccharimonadales bacterium]